jgi:hypothetical protein
MFKPAMPIRLLRKGGSYAIMDGQDRALAYVYFRDDANTARILNALHEPDARAMAKVIARAMRDLALRRGDS